jgi:hypothetical protein
MIFLAYSTRTIAVAQRTQARIVTWFMPAAPHTAEQLPVLRCSFDKRLRPMMKHARGRWMGMEDCAPYVEAELFDGSGMSLIRAK